MRYSKTKRAIFITDIIGQEADGFIGGDTVRSALEALGPGDVKIVINSPGGSIFEAWSMIEQLRQHRGRITTSIEGIAASAGSVIFLAGEFREMSVESTIMIHHVWTVAVGNHLELAKAACDLEKTSGTLVDYYVNKLGASRQQVTRWLDNETWFTSEESLQHRFAHRVTGAPTKQAASQFPLRDAAIAKLRRSIAKNSVDCARSACQEAIEKQEMRSRPLMTKIKARAHEQQHQPITLQGRLNWELAVEKVQRTAEKYHNHALVAKCIQLLAKPCSSPANPSNSWRAVTERILRSAEKYHDHATVARCKQLLAKP